MATRLVYGKPRYLDPRGSKTPEPIDIKLDGVIMSETSLHMHTLVFLRLRGAGLHMHEIIIIRVYFLTSRCFLPSCAPVQVTPFDRFSWFMAQKTYFRVIYVLFEVRTRFFLHFLLFFAKKRENYNGN